MIHLWFKISLKSADIYFHKNFGSGAKSGSDIVIGSVSTWANIYGSGSTTLNVRNVHFPFPDPVQTENCIFWCKIIFYYRLFYVKLLEGILKHLNAALFIMFWCRHSCNICSSCAFREVMQLSLFQFLSPFCKNALAAGIQAEGGKPDDITVLLATVSL